MTLIHGPVDPAEATAEVDAASDKGMKFIDTSYAHGNGKIFPIKETVGTMGNLVEGGKVR